jgi:glutamate formiminotransferase/formiminotetrahydrofolate cyclodeaminase
VDSSPYNPRRRYTPTTDLASLSFSELTARLASREPIPGGGSAAALAGAMGAALVSMVAELTVGRPDAAPHEAELRELRDAAVARLQLLQRLAEQDAAAYEGVVTARRLPKDTEEQRATRDGQLARAMVAAAEVPLRTAEVAAEVLDLAHRIAPIGNPNAVSDAGVGAQLASAAVRGAVLNVRINLPYLPAGAPLRETAAADATRLERYAADVEEATLAIVNGRIMPS